MNSAHLYIIQSGVTGAIKVGRSDSPARRLHQLQTGSPYVLRIILVLEGGGPRERELEHSPALARSRLIDWPVVGLLSLGSIPAALLTLYALHRLGPADEAVQRVMTSTLGLALLLTAAATLYKALRGGARPRAVWADELANATRPRHAALPVVFGAAIGALVTLTSVGAGAIGVSALMLLYPRLPLARIVAADIAYAVPLTLVAGLGHASLGSVDWSLLGLLLAGSIPGIWLGTRLVSRTPERLIRALLSLLLAWAGLKLISA
ncbi:MAG: TSUP family transporter [Burkholderiaceae bacterium]